MSDQFEAPVDGTALACRVVRALLDRNHVPKHKQTPVVAQILGVGYHAAFRRATGSVPYTLEELNELGAHFGESLLEVVGGATEFAFLRLSEVQIPCRVLLTGQAMTDPSVSRLVAVVENGIYVLVDSKSAGNRQTFNVRQILLDHETPVLKRIAVLDDDLEITKAICLDLGEEGYEPHPFNEIEDLLNAFKKIGFAAYIIDWSVGKTTAEELIAAVRVFDPISPIFILTGKGGDGSFDADRLAASLSGERMFFHTKPLATNILIAQLKKAIRQ